MQPSDRSAASTCTCGHSADWHSHDGAGDCEYDGECECQGFVSGPCPSCGQTCCAEGECCYGEGCRTSSAARDHDGFTPVLLFAHDYGTHLPYCEILRVETSIKCTCGFKEALEAALASERGESRV